MKRYLVTLGVAPKQYLEYTYKGPVDMEWCEVEAESPGKAKLVAISRSSHFEYEDFINLRVRQMDDNRFWTNKEQPDQDGFITESELNWYENAINDAYSAHMAW